MIWFCGFITNIRTQNLRTTSRRKLLLSVRQIWPLSKTLPAGEMGIPALYGGQADIWGHTDLSGPNFCTGSLEDLRLRYGIRRHLGNQPNAPRADSNVRHHARLRAQHCGAERESGFHDHDRFRWHAVIPAQTGMTAAVQPALCVMPRTRATTKLYTFGSQPGS